MNMDLRTLLERCMMILNLVLLWVLGLIEQVHHLLLPSKKLYKSSKSTMQGLGAQLMR